MCSITEAINDRPEAEIACIIKNFRNPSEAILYLDDGYFSTMYPIHFSEDESMDELMEFDGLKLVTDDYSAYQMRCDVFGDSEFIPFDDHISWCISFIMLERLKKECPHDRWVSLNPKLKKVTKWMVSQLVD